MPTTTSSGNPKRAPAWPWIWAALVTVAVLSAVGFGIAYLRATSAINCTNSAVGTRSNVGTPDPVLNRVLGRPAQSPVGDSDATRAVYRELNHLQVTQVQRDAYKAAFAPVLLHAQQVLDANQKYRLANPLGRC